MSTGRRGRHVGPIRIGTPEKRDMGVQKDEDDKRGGGMAETGTSGARADDKGETSPAATDNDSKAADSKDEGPTTETGLESYSRANLSAKSPMRRAPQPTMKLARLPSSNPAHISGQGLKLAHTVELDRVPSLVRAPSSDHMCRSTLESPSAIITRLGITVGSRVLTRPSAMATSL